MLGAFRRSSGSGGEIKQVQSGGDTIGTTIEAEIAKMHGGTRPDCFYYPVSCPTLRAGDTVTVRVVIPSKSKRLVSEVERTWDSTVCQVSPPPAGQAQ